MNNYLNMTNYIGKSLNIPNYDNAISINIAFFKIFDYCLNFNDKIILDNNITVPYLNYYKPIIYYIFFDRIYRSINCGTLDIGNLTPSAPIIAPMRFYYEINKIIKNAIIINNSYIKIPNNTIDLYSVNILNGISFSFWFKSFVSSISLLTISLIIHAS